MTGLSKAALVALGVLGTTYILTRRDAPKRKRKRKTGSKDIAGQQWSRLCTAQNWTDEEREQIRIVAQEKVQSLPASWASLEEAKDQRFEIVRGMVAELCPGMDLPDSRYQLPGYLESNASLSNMWNQIAPVVWYYLVG